MKITEPKPLQWVKVEMSEEEFASKLGLPADCHVVRVFAFGRGAEITMARDK